MIDTRTKVLLVLTIALALALIIFRDPLFCRQIYEMRHGEKTQVIGSTCDQDVKVDPPQDKPSYDQEDLITV